MSTATLTLNADIPANRLDQLTRDLGRDLSRAGVKATPAAAATRPGERGDAFSVGQLLLDLVTGGAVTGLIDCLKTYLARERSLSFRITRGDGTSIEVTAKNLDTASVRQALTLAMPDRPA